MRLPCSDCARCCVFIVMYHKAHVTLSCSSILKIYSRQPGRGDERGSLYIMCECG